MAIKNLKRKRNDETPDKTHGIIIGLDFGTTKSGVAVVHTGSPQNKIVINQWPDPTSTGTEGISSNKVPTEIKYEAGSYKWGFQILTGSSRHKWFKLDLDPSRARGLFSLATSLADRHALPPDSGPCAEQMITDFLRALRGHTETVMRYKLPPGALDGTPRLYCLTVPAVWSEKAQAATLACAKAAGLDEHAEIHMVTEPEAAATFTLDSMGSGLLSVGQTFVLCDCGGGTVDLISYQVIGLEPILKLKEVAPGTGGICGSTLINRFCEKYLTEKYGSHEDWDDDTLDEAMDVFDKTVKPSFTGNTDQTWRVPLRLEDNPDMGIRLGHIVMTGKEVQSFYQPVVDETITLVKGQIRSSGSDIPSTVLLVGGFGQSSYLREQIRTSVLASGINVIQSPRGETAIVEGALMKALVHFDPSMMRVNVCERVARRHYGTTCQVPFELRHDFERRQWSVKDGRYNVRVMEWFIRKGETVTESEPLFFSYYQDHLVSNGHPHHVEVTISASDDPNGTGAPTYPGRDIIKLTILQADLSKIPLERFEKVTRKDKRKYYNIPFQIRVTFLSGHTKYDLFYQGKNYGTVKAEYV